MATLLEREAQLADLKQGLLGEETAGLLVRRLLRLFVEHCPRVGREVDLSVALTWRRLKLGSAPGTGSTSRTICSRLLLRILRAGQRVDDWVMLVHYFDSSCSDFPSAGLLFCVLVVVVTGTGAVESAALIGAIFPLKLLEVQLFFLLLFAIFLISVIIIGSLMA